MILKLDPHDPHPLALDALLRQALDGAREALAIYTAEEWVVASTVVYANRALADLSGYAEEHFVGHSALLLAGAKPDATTLESILPASKGAELCTRTRKVRPDGSPYEVDVWVRPLKDARGNVTHYLATQRVAVGTRDDLTPAASARTLGRLRDASFTELAAGIAYELEPLASSCLDGLGVATSDGRGADALEEARRSAASLAATVRGLKAFGTEAAYKHEVADVHEALELAIRLAGPIVRERAILERRYAPVAKARVSLPRLARVLMSVLRNAGESIPPSSPHANHVTVETSEDGRGQVTIVVTDTGVGIEPRDLPFVFDPFFTTKRDAARTAGLGLAAARAEVSRVDGDIRIESAFGRGTRVWITLPAEPSPRLCATVPCLVTTEAPGPRLLAVGETHAAARQVAAPFADGPVVLTVATWSEALERLALGERFDLVVGDARAPRVADFRARLGELATEASARVFDVRVGGSTDSGTFPRVVVDHPDLASAE